MTWEKKLKIPPLLISVGVFAVLLASPSYVEIPLWYLKSSWLFLGDLRQSAWNSFLNIVGEDQFTIWVTGTFLILTVEYWVIGGLYTYMDMTLEPKALRKYKIQLGTNEPLTREKFCKVAKQVLYNQIIVGLPIVYLGGKLFMWRGPPPIRELPPIHWVLLQFVFFLLEQEFSYYYIHRLLHHKSLYGLFHKRHHEWTAPIAISAIYCHPVEQITANVFPIFFGCFLLNAHLTTYLSWFALAVLFTLSEHSGYHLPFMTSPEVHDFHHYSYNNNFGFLGILDGFHKTNLQYKKSRASKRHFILKGTKSARELVPDISPVTRRSPAVGTYPTEMSTLLIGITTAATVSLLMFSLLVSPVFRNDALQVIKNYYTLAGNVRQRQWNALLDIVGDDPAYLWSVGSWVILMTTYWTLGSLYTFFDLTNKPKAFRRYKVQPGQNEPLTWSNLFKILGLVLFNQVVVTLPLTFWVGSALAKRGTPPVRVLPPFYVSVLHILVCVLIEEFAFYYSHRLLHHRRIYKYIHKRHHKWTAPIAIVAIYAHPVEHVLSNLLPPVLGVILLNCHVFTGWLWFGLAVAFTLSEHSGYHLPFFPSSEAHDFHHFKFTNCFGVLGLLDWLHGTDLEFRKSMSYPRHRMLKGFKSARELYPEPERKKTR